MRAFVRFREVPTDAGPWFVAWFEPQHLIVEANVPFFRGRFANMRWSILTPDACAHWDPDKREATLSPGVPRSAAPAEDAAEALWLTYYASIFNPARVKISAMTSEMPRHYWKNLPEAAIIPQLLAESRDRVDAMVAKSAEQRTADTYNFGAAPVPATTDLAALHEAASTCRACPLWRRASCVVFGEGPPRARVVLVGEQPGDQEDRAGKPFVGPAGLLLNRALAAAGVDREALYVTNAVKHFKWEPRGKRRLHLTPDAREIAACRPWLEAELRALAPELIVCLGATAAESVTGRPIKVLAERGGLVPTEFGAPALITVHPSSLLRLPAGEDSAAAFARFVDDLRRITASGAIS
jgi:DNA polymerase